MIPVLSQPTAVAEMLLPDGSKGWLLRFDLDFSAFASYKIKLRYFQYSGEQIKFTPRSIQINNSSNANSVNVVYDNSIQYPHLAIAGQISIAQVPFLKNLSDILLTSTIAAGLIISVYISDYPMSPDSIGQSGSAVTVVNTVPVNIENAPDVYVTNTPTVILQSGAVPLPFSGITAAGLTALLAVNKLIFSIDLWASGDAIQAAAGDNLITVYDGTATGVPILEAKPNFPAASLGQIAFKIGKIVIPSGYQMVNGALNINLTTALTGGNIYGNVVYR